MIDPSHEGRHDTRQSDYCCLAVCAGVYLEQQQWKTVKISPEVYVTAKLLWFQYAQFTLEHHKARKRKKTIIIVCDS